MLFTIKEVKEMHSDKAGEYLQIVGFTGDGKPSTKNIFNSMKDKWSLLKEDTTVELKMQKKGEFWNVTDIIEPNLPPVVKEAVKQGAVIESATDKRTGKDVSIAKAVAFKGAMEMVTAKELPFKDWRSFSEEVTGWLLE